MMPASERRIVLPENQIDYLTQYGSQWGTSNLTEIVSRVIADHRIAGLQMVTSNGASIAPVSNVPAPNVPAPNVPASPPVENALKDVLSNVMGD